MGKWLEFKALQASHGDLDTKSPQLTTNGSLLCPSLCCLLGGIQKHKGYDPNPGELSLEGEREALCSPDPKMALILKYMIDSAMVFRRQ